MNDLWKEDEDRKQIVEMASVGIADETIADYVGFPKEKLKTEYREIIDRAPLGANLRVLNNLLDMAAGGRSGSTTIYWVKTRCGWEPKLSHREPDPPKRKGLPDFRVYINDGEPNYDG
jgi:hypothetical protein